MKIWIAIWLCCLSLFAAAVGVAEDEVPTATEPPKEPIATFELLGTQYRLIELQDVPTHLVENRYDGLPGHALVFSYDGEGADHVTANTMLYRLSRLATPDGMGGVAYSNYGNAENPYTIYYGLSKGVKLNQCTLLIDIDGEPLKIPLGEEAAEPSGNLLEALYAQGTAARIVSLEEFDRYLANLVAETEDPWESAILATAQVEPMEEDGGFSVTMRNFDPRLEVLGDYEHHSKTFMPELIEHIRDGSFTVNLFPKRTDVGHDQLPDLRRAVKNAADRARMAFDHTDVRIAIAEKMFPQPGDPLSDAFKAHIARLNEQTVPEQYAPLFIAQRSQQLNVALGPHQLMLSARGAKPEKLLSDAAGSLLTTLGNQYKANLMEPDAIAPLFAQALNARALSLKESASDTQTFAIDIDEFDPEIGAFGADYDLYIESYDYKSALDKLIKDVKALPDLSAKSFPQTGRMAGSSTGAQLQIKSPQDNAARYIQIRDANTNELVCELFLRPSQSTSAYLTQGLYSLLVAGGTNWYGTEALFGDEGAYSRTENTEILSDRFTHTITLPHVTDSKPGDPNISIADFRK